MVEGTLKTGATPRSTKDRAAERRRRVEKALKAVERQYEEQQQIYIPFDEWRCRWTELLVDRDMAYDDYYAAGGGSRTERGAYILPSPNTPEWAAMEEIFRTRVIPAERALEDFHLDFNYYPGEPPDHHSREKPRKKKTRATSAVSEEVRAALRDQSGLSKAALGRAVGGEDSRRQRQAIAAFERLVKEGEAEYEPPAESGGAGKCAIAEPPAISEPSEAPFGD